MVELQKEDASKAISGLYGFSMNKVYIVAIK